MHFQWPKYFWAELTPLLLLGGWIVAEWRRRRRLREFGDPAIMGVTSSWPARIARLLLLLFGISAVAAILPVPDLGSGADQPRTTEVLILLDTPSLESGGDSLWDSLESAIHEIADQSTGIRIGVLAPGTPLQTVVPPTLDAKGLQIVLARLRYEMTPGTRPGFAATLAAFVRSGQSRLPQVHLVVITAMEAEEIEHLPESVVDGTSGITFVRLTRDGLPAQFGRQTQQGAWSWARQPSERGGLPAEAQDTSYGGRLSPVQWLALLAMLLLSVECFCRLTVRAGGGAHA